MSQEPMKTVGGRGKVLATDPLDQVADDVAKAAGTYDWDLSPALEQATSTAVMPTDRKPVNFIHLDRVPIELDHAIEALLRRHGEIGARTLTLDQIVESLGDWLSDRLAGREETGPARWRARLIEEFSA